MGKTNPVKRLLGAVSQAARDPRPRVDRIMAAALALTASALYASVRNVFYSSDALSYAEAVEGGGAKALLHPHHLLYSPICRFAFGAARLLGYGGRALGTVHVVNAVAGGAGVALAFLLCRRLGARRSVSLLAAAGLATAAAYWSNAAGAEVYTLGTAAALAALYVAARVSSRGAKTAALAGVAFAAAAIIQQLNLLLAPLGVIYVLTTGTDRRRKALAFAGAYAATFILGYVVLPAALLHFQSPRDYFDWFFYYARMKRWGGFSWRNVSAAADAFARVFYVQAFWNNFAAPFAASDIRHLRVALPLWLGVAGGGANLLLWLARRPGRAALILLGVALLSYAVFILWWLPSHIDYWLLPAACVIFAVAVAVSGRGRFWYAVSVAALTLAWLGVTNVNWRYGIKPETRLEANADYRAGLALAAVIPKDGLAFLANSPAITHARYFGGLKRVRSPNWVVNRCRGDGDRAARVIEKMVRGELKQGSPVYLGGDAFRDLGGPPVRGLGKRLLSRGRPVGSYAGAEASETVYVLVAAPSGF